MSTPSKPSVIEEKLPTEPLPWYEDPVKLRQKREELGISADSLANLIGRHPSYVTEIEGGRIALKWEENGELLWSHLTEIQLAQGGINLLGSRLGKRFYADLEDEVRQLRERNQAQQQMIRNLEEQSSCWEALAETRAELIRNLRIELGEDPDADDGREQL